MASWLLKAEIGTYAPRLVLAGEGWWEPACWDGDRECLWIAVMVCSSYEWSIRDDDEGCNVCPCSWVETHSIVSMTQPSFRCSAKAVISVVSTRPEKLLEDSRPYGL